MNISPDIVSKKLINDTDFYEPEVHFENSCLFINVELKSLDIRGENVRVEHPHPTPQKHLKQNA
jgi:hypothetical protein